MNTRKGLGFDPRIKLFLLLLVNLLLLLSHSLLFEIVLFSISIIIVCVDGQRGSAFHFIIAFLLMLGIDRGLTPYLSGYVFTLVSFISLALRKVLPCLILGKWILTTTEVSEFVAAMWKVRLPQTAIIPLSVVFRYFPTIREEWGAIRAAMKMRGIHFSLEHIMVPLLMSAINVSEELSAAALCRGLDNPDAHTCMCEVKLHQADKVSLLLASLLAISAIALKGVGLL
ncbi:MAG: energy-coupling factor transporter transmembrane component T [Lachnospiraceae bacterium]